MKKLFPTTVAIALGVMTSSALATDTPTTIAQCPSFYEPASVELTLQLSTAPDCPALEDRSTRRLIDYYTVGATYAYPAVSGTCLVGSGLTGVITLLRSGHKILVEGSSASAQRLFPEAQAIDNGLLISGANSSGPFASGAATSVVTLKGTSEWFYLQIVTEDRFTLDYSQFPVQDVEEFTILGSWGFRKVIGRLVGNAAIHSGPTDPISNETFNIAGTVCMR